MFRVILQKLFHLFPQNNIFISQHSHFNFRVSLKISDLFFESKGFLNIFFVKSFLVILELFELCIEILIFFFQDIRKLNFAFQCFFNLIKFCLKIISFSFKLRNFLLIFSLSLLSLNLISFICRVYVSLKLINHSSKFGFNFL